MSTRITSIIAFPTVFHMVSDVIPTPQNRFLKISRFLPTYTARIIKASSMASMIIIVVAVDIIAFFLLILFMLRILGFKVFNAFALLNYL
jgi:hypothetical protein